ncbi:MAG: RNA-binding S4 domain-containing protein [Clostridiaceae bacterium]|nr:RNA-binding S4 domain-containing protein [Clostridiaceae bacterium]
MRLDKFLKVSRLIKRRTVANDFAEAGRVSVNGKIAKPGTKLKIGDIISITFGDQETKVIVKELNNAVKKESAAQMYEIIS